MNIERRTLPGTVEFRKEEGRLTARGYASVFEKFSQDLGGFVERAMPGAFKKTIQEQDVVALANHDPNLLLGRASAGTLRLSEDEKGLAYEIDLPDTTAGRDWATLLERRDVIGSSFGFRVIEDEWGETEQGYPLRSLRQVSLRDVGPVTFPAYSDSEAALRSLAEHRSLDLSLLVAAAEAGELRAILTPHEDGRETPTVVKRHVPRHYR